MMSTVKETFESLPVWVKYAAGAAVVAVPALKLILGTKARKSPVKEDWEPGVVYVYQFPRTNYVPSLSPFCLKLETWLRMANIKYENVPTTLSLKSKEGTLPFVEYEGVEYCDSNFAIRDLTKLLKKEGLETHLTAEQRGAARAFEQMIEGTTLASYAYLRYVELFWQMVDEDVTGFKPPFLWSLFLTFMSKAIKKRIMSTPTGKHARDEVIGIGLEDLKALSDYLGLKPFLSGHKPSKADATLFGTLANILYLPLDTPHKRLMLEERKNLKEYTDRMKKKFWADWEEEPKKRPVWK